MNVSFFAAAARDALRILLWQSAWVLIGAAFCATLLGARSGWSVLVGGGIGLIWSLYMTATLFRHSVDGGVRLSIGAFLVGWVIKIGLTVALLIIAFRSKNLAPLAVLGGLFGALFAYWVWLSFPWVKHAISADGK